MTMHPDSKQVLVIGGGLAGIAAAVRLAEHGQSVTLIETRQRLGGRATSFTDPTTGQLLDNCQHVLLGCCTNLLDLYQRLGVGQWVRWQPRIHFAFPAQGPAATNWIIDTMESDDLPAPLHLARSLLSFAGLSLREKWAISRGMLAVMQARSQESASLHRLSFASWLERIGQPASLIEKFWSPVVVSAINELPENMAADLALQVFQEGMLAHRQAWTMGLSSVPLVELYNPAARLLEAQSGSLLLSTRARALTYDPQPQRLAGLLLDDGRLLQGDAYVSALPFDRLAKIAPEPLLTGDRRLRNLGQIQTSPIIGIHLIFEAADDQPVMDLPHLLVTGTMIQWLFNKGMVDHNEASPMMSSGQEAVPRPSTRAQYLQAVISAAHRQVSWSAEQILAQAVAEVRSLLPRAAAARLLHGRVVKEKRATFSAAPGVNQYRPPAEPDPDQGDAVNLYLAGDWCRTGWPATMEGAVRSGYRAAESLLNKLGHPVKLLVDDLPPAPLYRLLANR